MKNLNFSLLLFVLLAASSSSAFRGQNCYLTMKLKPDFYYIASPHVVRVDHVQIVATVVHDKTYPIYQYAISDELRARGEQNPQFDVSELEQISFDLPNVPGLVDELRGAKQEHRVLYMDFSWLSEDCSAFQDFQFRSGKKYAHFNYSPEHMSYQLHATDG